MYLKRAAALLEVALVNWALQRVTVKGFLPMTTPDLVRDSVLEKCGFQPRADNTQVGWVAACLPGICCSARARSGFNWRPQHNGGRYK